MATITSRIPALIDYLVELYTNAPTIGQANPSVTVYDGPPTTALDAPLKLFVGLQDPDSQSAERAADYTQEWGGIGRLARNETSTIYHAAEAWTGDDTMSAARLAVYGITAAVEALVMANADQFGGNVLFPAPGFTGATLVQNNTSQGAVARVQFGITFKSRIGGA